MDKNIALKISNLSKSYNLNIKDSKSIFEQLKGVFKLNKDFNIKTIYALKDINITINKGESIGIIGKNGAGKSTLLKLIAEVIEPTEGTIEINGSVASVLEIGMGFHPELTGIENIFLNGLLLGLNKKEIKKKNKEIYEFAGIGEFINTPVKYYSSGMYLRLAFALVAHLDADILLFDETFNTGDFEFQLKCYEKIKKLLHQKKTIIFVSHNLNDILRLCKRIIYLENGKVKEDSFETCVDKYVQDTFINSSLFSFKKDDDSIKLPYNNNKLLKFDSSNELNNNYIMVKSIQINAINKSPIEEIFTNDEIELSIVYFYKQEKGCVLDIGFSFSHMNTVLLYLNSLNSLKSLSNIRSSGYYKSTVKIPSNFFNSSTLLISVQISLNYSKIIFAYNNALTLTIKNPSQNQNLNTLPLYIGPIYPRWEWESNQLKNV